MAKKHVGLLLSTLILCSCGVTQIQSEFKVDFETFLEHWESSEYHVVEKVVSTPTNFANSYDTDRTGYCILADETYMHILTNGVMSDDLVNYTNTYIKKEGNEYYIYNRQSQINTIDKSIANDELLKLFDYHDIPTIASYDKYFEKKYGIYNASIEYKKFTFKEKKLIKNTNSVSLIL